MNLSDHQEEIIILMQQGWELKTSSEGIKFTAWLQYQDETKKKVHLGSFWAIGKLELIDLNQETYPISTWNLTTKGRNHIKNS